MFRNESRTRLLPTATPRIFHQLEGGSGNHKSGSSSKRQFPDAESTECGSEATVCVELNRAEKIGKYVFCPMFNVHSRCNKLK